MAVCSNVQVIQYFSYDGMYDSVGDAGNFYRVPFQSSCKLGWLKFDSFNTLTFP